MENQKNVSGINNNFTYYRTKTEQRQVEKNNFVIDLYARKYELFNT